MADVPLDEDLARWMVYVAVPLEAVRTLTVVVDVGAVRPSAVTIALISAAAAALLPAPVPLSVPQVVVLLVGSVTAAPV